jgi:nicotinamidase-related amidase
VTPHRPPLRPPVGHRAWHADVRAPPGGLCVGEDDLRVSRKHDALLDTALRGPHADLVEPVRPDDRSLFVVKARHSAFYETPLEYLLRQHGIGRIVLCGQVTEQCILYSALDAHIRHRDVSVAEDAVAHIHADLADAALRMMERNVGAHIATSADTSLRL